MRTPACGRALTSVLVCATAIVVTAEVVAQGTQLWLSSSGLHVRVPGVGLLEGRVLERLRDGRSVEAEAALDVLTRPGGPVEGRARLTCTFSFDLWEERFAVRTAVPSPRSISHLRANEAEAWCVDQLAVPLARLGTGASDQPFWIRLDLSADDPRSLSATAPLDEGFTLERIIDVFSQRRRESSARRTIEAGPLRVTP